MSRRRRAFKEVPADDNVRSSGMRTIDYHRYRLRTQDRQQRWFANVYLLDDARRRSYMLQSFPNRPLNDETAAYKFRLKTAAKPQPKPWIEHVRDGKPLTEHGAELLKRAV